MVSPDIILLKHRSLLIADDDHIIPLSVLPNKMTVPASDFL